MDGDRTPRRTAPGRGLTVCHYVAGGTVVTIHGLRLPELATKLSQIVRGCTKAYLT